jgi:hypothetical protein
MLVFKSTLAGAALLSVCIISPAAANDIPPRTAGLWLLKSQDNPFADWSICINETRNDFIDTDVWDNFANECEVTSSNTKGSSGKIEATCKLTDKTDAKLQLTFSGDFKSGYGFESVTEFVDAAGKKDTIEVSAKVTYAGECPAELKPGMKKMTRSGMIIRP